jgi:hypothetical protein
MNAVSNYHIYIVPIQLALSNSLRCRYRSEGNHSGLLIEDAIPLELANVSIFRILLSYILLQ